jgi:hypothetical protein
LQLAIQSASTYETKTTGTVYIGEGNYNFTVTTKEENTEEEYIEETIPNSILS